MSIPRYFSFTNSVGRQVHLHIGTIEAAFQHEDGDYVIQCSRSVWLTNEADFNRLVRLLKQIRDGSRSEADWWKSEEDNEDDET